MCDWIGWAIGAAGIAYAVWSDHKNKQKMEIAHRVLVMVKPYVQGENKKEMLDAINDSLELLKPSKNKKKTN